MSPAASSQARRMLEIAIVPLTVKLSAYRPLGLFCVVKTIVQGASDFRIVVYPSPCPRPQVRRNNLKHLFSVQRHGRLVQQDPAAKAYRVPAVCQVVQRPPPLGLWHYNKRQCVARCKIGTHPRPYKSVGRRDDYASRCDILKFCIVYYLQGFLSQGQVFLAAQRY